MRIHRIHYAQADASLCLEHPEVLFRFKENRREHTICQDHALLPEPGKQWFGEKTKSVK